MQVFLHWFVLESTDWCELSVVYVLSSIKVLTRRVECGLTAELSQTGRRVLASISPNYSPISPLYIYLYESGLYFNSPTHINNELRVVWGGDCCLLQTQSQSADQCNVTET